MDELLCILAGEGPQHIAQIAWRQVCIFGEPRYSGYALPQEGVVVKVIVQQLFELFQQIAAGGFSGNELSSVKAIGKGQQQIDLGEDDILAEIIDPAVQFSFDHVEDAEDGPFFFLGQVKRFVGRLREKTVLFYLFGERMAEEEIRMYQQGVRAAGSHLRLIIVVAA